MFRPDPAINLPEDKLSKLPRYARDELTRLSQRLKEAQDQIDRAQQAAGNCVANTYGAYPTNLGDDARIEYTHEDRVIEVRFRDGVAIVSTKGGKASTVMSVVPRASNSALITTLDRKAAEAGR